MGQDWEKLAGEKGERVSSGKFERMFKLGSVSASVAASSFAGKMKRFVKGDAGEDELRDNYRKNAAKITQALGQLKGASMKVGQMLSADPEMIPPEFAEGLSALQRDAPPMTWNTLKSTLEEALDQPLESVFRHFDPEPVGAASIGQVHRGTLLTGEKVAVKVQYPGVADALESDLEALKSMIGFGQPFVERERLDRYFAEIKEVLMTEADYLREADELERWQEILTAKPFLQAPKPFKEFTRKNVLVMEFIEGDKLDVAIEKMDEDDKELWLRRWIEIYVWMFHELSELHADPHPGNFLFSTRDGQTVLTLLDFGCVRKFDPAFTDGILELLDTCWQDDPERAVEIYQRIGFGGERLDFSTLSPTLVAQYHDIVLTPFLRDEAFDFGNWQPAFESKKFMMSNPAFLALTPPPDALMYFRVLSGIKGLLGRFGAQINVYPLAVETARRRGVLTDTSQ